MMDAEKARVRDFWDEASCGERLLLSSADSAGFLAQAKERYRLEPYIPGFAAFEESRGLRVLEIGVGLGADHQQFVEHGAKTTGVDLTPRAIEMTKRRLACFNLTSDLRVADAEALPFDSEQFDVVYSWGVIHHSPHIEQAIQEIHRVLKSGGKARIMIYSKWSLVGLMLWMRYGLMRLRPFTSLKKVYSEHLESPGTKAYSVQEAKGLFRHFSDVSIRTVLSHGDLLSSGAGQRHEGTLLRIARAIWPRWFITRFLNGLGLFMMIEARKPIA